MSENHNLNAKMLPLTEQVLETQIAGSYETIPKKYCFVIAMYFLLIYYLYTFCHH